MKLIVSLFLALALQAADWSGLAQYSQQKVELRLTSGSRSRLLLVSASADSIIVRDNSGERSIPRAEVAELRLYDPAHHKRQSFLFTALGAAAGAGLGVAVCPGCANEGNGAKFVAPGAAAGAGLGALSFLSSSYRTIYRDR
jgi:hypothetical protein